jgi:hypothetical protein
VSPVRYEVNLYIFKFLVGLSVIVFHLNRMAPEIRVSMRYCVHRRYLLPLGYLTMLVHVMGPYDVR